MNTRCRAGLIPLYLELYDTHFPGNRAAYEPLLSGIQSELGARGIDLVVAPISRTAHEFEASVRCVEDAGVDALITVHLAYSPSLESIAAFTSSNLPLAIFDTTMDAGFGCETAADRIAFNHGIHGVQDFACVLRRHGRDFRIVAGHAKDAGALDRLASIVRAAKAARLFRNARVLRIGPAFKGMGDFSVDSDVLERALGIEVRQIGTAPIVEAAGGVTRGDIDAEMALDRERYRVEVSDEVHRRSVSAGLALRRLLEDGGYSAFSMNFLSFDMAEGPVQTVPFLEAAKSMARGVGYAGEGDVLTAALVGALAPPFGAVNFTEMFCPDWAGGTVFFSHMGEFNPATAAGRARMVEKEFPWTPAGNPAILVGQPLPGRAVLVNCAPGPGETFTLIIAPGEMRGEAREPEMLNTIRGWFRPDLPLGPFLEQYSLRGGTHHSALVHGHTAEALEAFAQYAGLPHVTLSGTGLR